VLNPLFPFEYKPKIPIQSDYIIGLIGAGQIANQAHLPAYRKAGFRVAAITDKNLTAAEETAARFGIPRVCESTDELLAIEHIQIVDIAVPARDNPELSRGHSIKVNMYWCRSQRRKRWSKQKV
jgi:predicted dehydrogenase